MSRNKAFRIFEGELQHNFQQSRAKIQIFGGGFANGKTAGAVIKAIHIARDYPGANILIARSTYPKLNDTIRKGPAHYLLDRLLIAAVVERRGHERFGLIATALGKQPMAKFYQAITASEDRHWQLFINLAETHCERRAIPDRLQSLVDTEASILATLPLRPALH